MSTEQAETQENTEVQTDTVENTTPETTEPTEKTYAPRVDLSALPDDVRAPVEARFTHLSGLMKKQEREFERKLTDYRSIAEQQSKQIDDLMSGVGQVVDHLSTRSFADTELQLQQKMQTAFDAGDNKEYVKAQDDLNKLRLGQLTKPKPQTPQKTETQRQAYAGYKSAGDLADDAARDGDLTPQQVQIVNAWQEETDDSGRTLRPWAFNTSDDPEIPDPDFIKANLIAYKAKKQNPNMSAEQILMEIDKQMGVRKSNGKQTVMGGSLTSPAKQNRIALSPRQEQLAIKTKFGARDGAKTDSDHIAAFKKQLEKVKGATSGRR